ncbi:MAG: NADH-quinone oxidoreductase subunit NuoG [Acidobacteriia bacterium]|nr:NADH-quinone oxidoreductase subunit NuoG [Terriglobia bacterium]
MPETVTLTINERQVTVPAGTLLIEAARQNDIRIPSFCYVKDLTLQAACRMCLVEIEKAPKLQVACTTVCMNGMVVRTESQPVIEARRAVLEFILTNHPLDCPVCDKGGECELQDMTFKYGPGTSRFIEEKEHQPEQQVSPIIFFDAPRCILCYRCVRICDEGMDVKALEPIGRGVKTIIGTGHDTLDCEDCGNCIDICPVGAITSNQYRYKTRPWELKYFGTTCTHCSNGCKTTLSVRNNEIIRANNRDRTGINEEFLCVKGRFGFDYVGSGDRLKTPLVRRGGTLQPASWNEALGYVADRLGEIRKQNGPDSIGALGSPRLTNEENYLLQKFMRQIVGTNNLDHHRTADYASLEVALAKHSKPEGLFNVDQIKTARTILVIGDDPTTQQPLVAFNIRFAVRRHEARVFIVNSKQIKLLRKAVASLILKEGSEAALVAYLARREGSALEKVAAETGLSMESIESFEKELRASSDVAILFGAEVRGKAIHDLVEFGTSLAGTTRYLALSDFANSRGALDMGVVPNLLPGYAPTGAEAARARFEEVWQGSIPRQRGLSGPDMVGAIDAGRMKAMILFGANPLEDPSSPPDGSPGPARVATLGKLDLLVVSDLFLTETGRHAHVVLPSASFAEKEGTITNCGGQVQRLQRAVLPPGEAKSDLEIIVDLARACGALTWMHMPWSTVLKEIAAVNPGYEGVTARALLEGAIPQTTLAASREALPDVADLNALAESIRSNRSRSLYASGSLAWHSRTLVQLEPRAAVQQAFVERYQM